MAQRDWKEVLRIIEGRGPGLIADFVGSDDLFLPNERLRNPFDEAAANFSAAELGKEKPGNWIPVYRQQDLPLFFREHGIFPIRAGQAEFFFYRGRIFFDLEGIDFEKVDTSEIRPIASFVPVSLRAKFQRNENAYLNKAVALGYINHFLDNENLHILERTIENSHGRRLLYGQFGKIKTTKPLEFRTSKESKAIRPGFQFEIDLVLENEDEVIIFEAKCNDKPTKSFSLLQLYYLLIYLRSILKEQKKLRTVFIDITVKDGVEMYRLMEVIFEEEFDRIVPIKNAN